MDISSAITEALTKIEESEHVTILLAVESGSRAWGFASPDSDYDVRFIYLRSMEEYLRLDAPKDTIEWQLDEVLDINGWDLRKALIQFHRGNATLFEWSNSPVIYKKTDLWDTIYETARVYFSEKTSICHYYGTARNTYESFLRGEEVKYKKYFYALRPLLACRYIEEYHREPPIAFEELLTALSLPSELFQGIQELLEIKKVTEEKDLNPQLPIIQDFIASELPIQKELADTIADDHIKNWDTLNHIFQTILYSQS